MDTYYDPIETICTRCRVETNNPGLCSRCAAMPQRNTAGVYADYADLYESDQDSQVLFNAVITGNLKFFEDLVLADQLRAQQGVKIRPMAQNWE